MNILQFTTPANRGYLSWTHFFQMLVLAAVTHVVAMIVISLIPRDPVVNVPIKVLSIKLGNSDAPETETEAAHSPPAGDSYTLGSESTVSSEAVAIVGALPEIDMREETNEESYQKVLKSLENTISVDKSSASGDDAKSLAEMLKDKKPVLKPAAPERNTLPKQFVRERDMGEYTEGAGSVMGNSTSTEAQILARYEQLISGWIQRFKRYPPEARAAGIEGQAVVRIRIDRNGKVLFSRLERPTGHTVLDAATMDMIKQANPIPPVPDNYPAGNLLEFLIPVSFKL